MCVCKIIKSVLLSQALSSKIVIGFLLLKLFLFLFISYGIWIGRFIAVNMLSEQTYYIMLPAISVLYFFAVFLVYELKDRKMIK